MIGYITKNNIIYFLISIKQTCSYYHFTLCVTPSITLMAYLGLLKLSNYRCKLVKHKVRYKLMRVKHSPISKKKQIMLLFQCQEQISSSTSFARKFSRAR